MNLFPSVQGAKEIDNRRKLSDKATILRYEQKLLQYREALDDYKNYIFQFAGKLESIDHKNNENQLSFVQTALDLTYIKEQGDKVLIILDELKTDQANKLKQELESILTSMIETNFKVEDINKNMIYRFTQLLEDTQRQILYQYQQAQMEISEKIERLEMLYDKSKVLLWILLGFHILGLIGIVFIVLYLLEWLPI